MQAGAGEADRKGRTPKGWITVRFSLGHRVKSSVTVIRNLNMY